MGGVAGLHEPGPQDDGGAPVVGQCGLDEFDGAAGPDDSDDGLDDIDRDGAKDVEGQPGENQPVDAAGVPVELDDVYEQAQRRGDVLLVRIPRTADMAGGAEGRPAHPLEVRHRVAPARRRARINTIPV